MSGFLELLGDSLKHVIEAKLNMKLTLADLFIKVIDNLLSDPAPKSIIDIAQSYSKACDLLIIDGEQKEGLSYVGGKLHIILKDSGNFFCSTDLYFQNNQKKWIQKSATSDSMPVSVLSAEALSDLTAKTKITFEVDAPVKN